MKESYNMFWSNAFDQQGIQHLDLVIVRKTELEDSDIAHIEGGMLT